MFNDFGYLMEHLYGRDGIAYEDYEYQLPKKNLQKETLIKYYDLIRPTRCVIEESQRYLRLEHEDKESYVSYFTVNAIVGELDLSLIHISIRVHHVRNHDEEGKNSQINGAGMAGNLPISDVYKRQVYIP